MKRFTILIATGVLAWTSAHATGGTSTNDPRFTDGKLQAIEKNLQMALESESFGLQTSAAQVVRDVKALVPRYEFSHLVIPLMRILKDESAPSASRVLAALALHDLGSERGDFAIKRVGEFTHVGQVKLVCVSLARERLRQADRQDDPAAGPEGGPR